MDADEPVPDLAEPIIAWRAWKAVRFNPLVSEDEIMAAWMGNPTSRPSMWSDTIIGLDSVYNSAHWPTRKELEATGELGMKATCAGLYGGTASWLGAILTWSPDRELTLVETACTGCPSPPDDGRHKVGKGCGIYAAKTLGDLVWDFPMHGVDIPHEKKLIAGNDTGLVFGKVALWGKVYPYQYGYRAEFARVESIVVIDGCGRYSLHQLDHLATEYGVPLEVLSADDAQGQILADLKRREDIWGRP